MCYTATPNMKAKLRAAPSAPAGQDGRQKNMSDLDRVLAHIDADMGGALERLFTVLRIKSISTDPAFAKDCAANAEWHAADLRSIGFEASARPTPGHPIVVAHDRSAKGASALFYGHYDVQPVDPLELWDRDPFDPVIEALACGTTVLASDIPTLREAGGDAGRRRTPQERGGSNPRPDDLRLRRSLLLADPKLHRKIR